jgi:hypothetical protein
MYASPVDNSAIKELHIQVIGTGIVYYIYHVGNLLLLNNIVLLRDVFHIGLVIGPKPAVLA